MSRTVLVALIAGGLASSGTVPAGAQNAGVNDGRNGVIVGAAGTPGGRIVIGHCAYRQNFPEYIPMMSRGVATSAGESPPAATTIRCVVRNRNGAVALERTDTAEGPVVTTANSGLGPANLPPFTLCAAASATWADGGTVRWPGPGATDLACTAPIR